MANTEKAPILLTTQEQPKEKVELNQGSGRVDVDKAQPSSQPAPSKGDFAMPSVAVADQAKTTSTPTDSQPPPPPARPTLIQLGSTTSQSSSSSPVAPHPKKFSAVNINKKFLEKNSSATTAAPSSSMSSAKSGSPVSRPQAPQTSHSRLVTAKLTATPSHSTGTAGWSRPSSVAPSPAATTGTSSPSGTSPLPTAANLATATPAAPQLPHVGKVIQPQPRTTLVQQGSLQKDSGSNKPVWGAVKPPPPVRPDITPSDFPTAAEVANATTSSSRKPKPEETKPSTSDAARQARLEEADTFRGLHLDPNAHHWDEDEEDDDNFLGGVIEFGDGRQYKIEATPEPPPVSPPLPDTKDPVSKEDRFGEDFDRSWPRSRASPASSSRDFPSAPAPHSSTSPGSSIHQLHSPQESSRVLFNERSNRLEPYSHRPPPGQYQPKRGSFESSSSGVQLLQKPGGGGEFSRAPALGRREGGFGPGPGPFGDRRSERDVPGRRDVPPSPRMSKDGFGHAMGPTTSWGGRDRDSDRGRRSDMGPPPLPAHTMRRPSRDSGRQLPPHLSQLSPNLPARPLPMREPPPPSGSIRHPSQSPAMSHKSLAAISPIAGGQAALPPLSSPELDEVRKGLMHTAAERAKQRREQEEAEREAQKERARKKAAELEAKMKAAEEAKAKEVATKEQEEENAKRQAEESAKKVDLDKEQEVLSVIEDAISSVKVSKTPSIGPQRRPVPLKSTAQQDPQRRTSGGTPRIPSVPTPATEANSWRAKASPLPPSSPSLSRQNTSQTPNTTFLTPQPSAMEQVGTIRKGAAADELEVVDFSDMGKFVSVPEADQPPVDAPAPPTSAKPARPVASDFFEDKKDEVEVPSSATKSDFGTWRRQAVHDVSTQPPAVSKDTAPSTKDLTSEEKARATVVSVEVKEHDRRNVTQIVTVPPHIGHNQRTPRGQNFYKESTMSALDDAMSRIKGALDASKESHPSAAAAEPESIPRVSLPSPTKPVPPVPQPPQPPQLSPPPPPTKPPSQPSQPTLPAQPPKDRWIPPARRPRALEFRDEPAEVFGVTVSEPPLSPKPAWNSFAVKFPKDSRPLEFIAKRQLHSFSRPPYPPRWDILSFDPPVEGMNKRDLSVNEILFRKPPGGFKGKRYRVFLPRTRLPFSGVKVNGVGAFGRPTVADGASSWRKTSSSAASAVPQDTEFMGVPTQEGLDTTSRSPPPETLRPQTSVASLPKSTESSLSKADSVVAPIRSRSIPKMPAGSAVAVLRDSRIDVIEADSAPRVNFIVTSELEDGQQEKSEKANETTASGGTQPMTSDSKPLVNGTKSSPSTADSTPKGDVKHQISSLVPSKTDNKSSDDSTDPLSTHPSHHTSPWARTSLSLPVKESGVRAPDPEHLKAVWSQTSEKAGSHAVNSLEGIVDDLTALPFTIQDVKSEDGGTPPPAAAPSAPSRMSVHDVTRAFQTVPSSSNSAAHRAPLSPPTTNAPVARPTQPSYSYSPMPSNMRPTYSYSPMMSHSPAPVIYPHQVTSSPVPPNRMPVNGHAPMYAQPVWMPMAGPSPQNPGGMMRAVPSPYPVPYPSTPVMYPSPQGGMPPPNPQQQPNGMAGRGRGMPMMAHGAPMYGGSPVLMHAQAMQVPQNHGYMPVPAGRGQGRQENGHMGSQQHHPPPHSHNSYNTPPPNFARSAW